jgi:hypothetical protein
MLEIRFQISKEQKIAARFWDSRGSSGKQTPVFGPSFHSGDVELFSIFPAAASAAKFQILSRGICAKEVKKVGKPLRAD